jgi:PLP dependent protein
MRYPRRTTMIGERIDLVRKRIAAAADRAGRDPASVRLIGVVKDVSPAALEEALRAGLGDLGENYTQEAERHREALGPVERAPSWHLIGHLQTNKAAAAVRLFDTIQSIDSVRLAQQLSAKTASPLRILLEVNVAGEPSKYGLAPAEVARTVSDLARVEHLELVGLMTIAPSVSSPEDARPVFQQLRELAEANALHELSMGMTGDFEVAVEEGATMVRIGRAIFGER